MRIIKLSRDEEVGGFSTEDAVVRFFEKTLPKRTLAGRFNITPAKENMPDLQKDTLLIFSYKTQCMYVGRSDGSVTGKSDDTPFFVIRTSTLRKIDVRLRDYETALRRYTGVRQKFVRGQHWPQVPDKFERFTLRFSGQPTANKSNRSQPMHCLDDLEVPPAGSAKPDRAKRSTSIFLRDEKVRRYVVGRAKGQCEFCGARGFNLPSRKRYVETHHIISLANSGPDTPANVIALCPNHHREAHYGADATHLEVKLQKRLSEINAR